MIKLVRIGLGTLLLAAPLFIVACGGNGSTVSTAVAPSTALWVVPDNTASDNLVTIFNAAPDNLYYNVHSASFMAGQIRGQLDGAGAVRIASLNEFQEVTTPTPLTGAFGAGVLSVDPADNAVRGFIITSGLTGADNAHVHNAARGQVGPVVLTLTGGPIFWVVPDNTFSNNIAAILAAAPDNLYFNVHTTDEPQGQIRGQLDTSGEVRLATLDEAQDNVTPLTGARGAGIMVVDNNIVTPTNRVAGFIVSSGLTGTAAHIHNAARGTAGDIVVSLIGGPTLWVTPGGTTATATGGTVSPELVAIFNAAPDNLYLNVHTTAEPTGQIRGQLDGDGEIRFATLNGAQDNVATAAYGGAIVSIDNSVTGDNTVRGFIVTTGLAGTAAHIHNAARGTPGPIIVTLLPAP